MIVAIRPTPPRNAVLSGWPLHSVVPEVPRSLTEPHPGDRPLVALGPPLTLDGGVCGYLLNRN